MTFDAAVRTLRSAVEAKQAVDAPTLAAIVERMNSLPHTSEERAKLHHTLTAYASVRTASGRPPTGSVQIVGTSPRQNTAVKQRVAKLRQRAALALADGKPVRKLTRAERTRRIGLAILEAEEAGVL